MRRAATVRAPALTPAIRYCPSDPDVAPSRVPSTSMATWASGPPERPSVTRPMIVPRASCAASAGATATINAATSKPAGHIPVLRQGGCITELREWWFGGERMPARRDAPGEEGRNAESDDRFPRLRRECVGDQQAGRDREENGRDRVERRQERARAFGIIATGAEH